MILAVRTDSPTAQLALYNQEGERLAGREWLAERRLAHELLGVLENFLAEYNGTWSDLAGLVVYSGPGSFTGLRIGITVMNTIAYGQGIPIVGVTGEAWHEAGVSRLRAGEDDHMVMPEYGAPARITQPRK